MPTYERIVGGYNPQLSASSRVCTTTDGHDHFNCGLPAFHSNPGFPALPINSLRTYRSWENAPHTDLINVFGSQAVSIRYRKKKVGNVLKFRLVERFYRDSRGRLRSRLKKTPYYEPVYIKVPHVVKHQDLKTASRNNSFYLKPNRLRFEQSYDTFAPREVNVWQNVVLGGYSIGHQESVVTGPGYFDVWYSYVYLPKADAGNVSGVGDSEFASLDEKALTKLYNKAASALPNYFTAAAESPELLKLIRHTAKEGLKFIREIYKLDAKRLAGRLSRDVTPESLSSLWLTWLYAVSPVLNDVSATLEILGRESRVWRTYSASATESVDAEYFTAAFSGSTKVKSRRTSRYGIILEGRLSAERYLLRSSHWQTVAGTTYEIIPASFMLDWLVDISSYLNSCTIFSNLQYAAWRTRTNTSSASLSGHLIDRPNVYQGSDDYTSLSSKFICERSVMDSLPDMPDIKVNKPVFDLTSLQRAINSTMILIANPQFLKPTIKSK